MNSADEILAVLSGTAPGRVEQIGRDYVLVQGFDRLIVTPTVKRLIKDGLVKQSDEGLVIA